MTMTMTKAEAIAHMKDRGLHAFERDWVIGQTIGVAVDAEAICGITAFRRLAYIAKREAGWIVEEVGVMPADDSKPEVMSLEAACARAESILLSGS